MRIKFTITLILLGHLQMKSDSPNPIAYIACTERSQTTLLCFEKAMEEHSLVKKLNSFT